VTGLANLEKTMGQQRSPHVLRFNQHIAAHTYGNEKTVRKRRRFGLVVPRVGAASLSNFESRRQTLFNVSRSRFWAIAVGLWCALACAGTSAAPAQLIATGLQFAEGTVFIGETLYFVDFATSDVLRLVAGKVEKVWHKDGCGANGLLQVPTGLFVACYSANTVNLISFDGRLLNTIVQDDAGNGFQSPNDFVSDRQGGAYFTASGSGGRTGKIYHLDSTGHVRQVAANLSFANGIALSRDGKLLYVTESTAGQISVMSIRGDSTLGEPRVFVKLGELLGATRETQYVPDSMRADGAGNLFVCLYEGGGIIVIDARGALVKSIELPGQHHTSLAISSDSASIVATAVNDVPSGYEGRLFRVSISVDK